MTRTINHWIDGKLVASSLEAFEGWSATPPLRRARFMCKFGELIEANLKEMAATVTPEHVKILSNAEGSIIRGMEVVELATSIPHFLQGG
jgi:malonate-semialdehyde dehydrogenase (acetylating) / methylmalonate-semialdehyde dehydrogenase